MKTGRPWDDFWWLVLYAFSKISIVVWILVDVGFTTGLCLLFWQSTQSFWVVPIFFIYGSVMGRVGLEWIRFHWNKVLQDEFKHTSLEK